MTFFPSTFITIFAVLYCACSPNVMNSKWPAIHTVWKWYKKSYFRRKHIWIYAPKLLRVFGTLLLIFKHCVQSHNYKDILEFPQFLIVHIYGYCLQSVNFLEFLPRESFYWMEFFGRKGSECFQFLTSNPLSHASSSFFVPPPAGYSLFMSKKQSYI